MLQRCAPPRRLQGDVVYLSWPIASLVYEPKCGGGVAGSRPMRTAVHTTWHWAHINIGDLTPYLPMAPPPHPPISGMLRYSSEFPLSTYLLFSMDHTPERSMLTSLIKYPSSIQRTYTHTVYPRTHDSLSISFRKHSLKNKKKNRKGFLHNF